MLARDLRELKRLKDKANRERLRVLWDCAMAGEAAKGA